MKKIKPKVGIIFVTSSWFRHVGLQDGNSELSTEVENVGREIVDRLMVFSNPIYPGIIYSKEGAQDTATRIRESNVSFLLVCPLMWCEDQVLRVVLKSLPNLPIILLTVYPLNTLASYLQYQDMLLGSGIVGSLQFSGMLKREKRRYHSVSGYYKDDSLYKTLSDHISALQIKDALRNLIVGVLPFPCDQMSTTFVDNFTLRTLYGIEIKYLELLRFKNEAVLCSLKEIRMFREKCSNLGWEIHSDEDSLEEGIRYALAFDKIRRKEGLGVIAMNDVIDEMHVVFGLRPSLDNPDLSNTDFTVSMEADIAAGVGLYILKMLSSSPPLYTEVLGVDIEKNELLMGHAGYHDTSLADTENPIIVVNDVEYKRTDKYKGACTCFKMKPGKVTLVNSVFHKDHFTWTVISGESLPGPIKLEDTTHLVFQPDIPVKGMLNRSIEQGVSQHWLVVMGDQLKRICVLSKWLEIEIIDLGTGR